MSFNCRIVVADDNRDAADSLVAILTVMGYEVTAAYDGREAVEACAAFAPGLAILDVQMPLLDGCSAARLIRASANPPGVIAALSGVRHWDEPIKSQSAVFDVRLAKPVRMEELRSLLEWAPGPGSRDPGSR